MSDSLLQVRFLGWEDPLEKEMAAHSSILAWEIPWTEEPGELWTMKVESEKVGLKLNIQKTKIMASGPITSWHAKNQLSRVQGKKFPC